MLTNKERRKEAVNEENIKHDNSGSHDILPYAARKDVCGGYGDC